MIRYGFLVSDFPCGMILCVLYPSWFECPDTLECNFRFFMARIDVKAGSGILKLLEALNHIGVRQRPALVCIAGASGSGKSFLGKFIRKGGLPGYPMHKVAVIDDGVMSRNLLGGLLRPKVRFPASGLDELAPFRPFISRSVDVVFFVCSTPMERVSHCDLLLVLHCDDGVRKSRLLAREGERALGRLQRENNVDPVGYPYPLFRMDVNSAELFVSN
ncbi:hypothetical protein EHS17_10920 [Rhodobacteraceae bacterium CH30]|nr:hypothetical protein EHS17_10920 [Rhodobacteraceae bacterium CH30]